MKIPAFIAASLLLSTLVASAQDPPANEVGDLSIQSKALDVAAAFSNEGYRIRDGLWTGTLERGRPALLQVNLFDGNEYWFCAAASQPARQIAVSIFDEEGKPVDFLTYEDGSVAAAGLEPDESGPYILKVELIDGEKAPFCLIYTYK